jgi:hypothetical protein
VYNDKLPPHDIAAEEAVIGSLLIDGAAIYEIATLLQKGDFYHEPHQWLYDAIPVASPLTRLRWLRNWTVSANWSSAVESLTFRI